ncbi:TonB-dependent siderophore receptor [Pantoea sp. Ap-967]|uniref:TonB-dependent siderophore receptor n=1 Tax=Pantoea sp. Ap-967 TaxID=2608362 RepID=UPI00141FDCF5|nr:TonB-dependent receptor [Pantoea sp. Ap-967]NIE76181.1 TonB-dependent siderophore receptor [Pantoea sp. Ap-967]
MGNSFSPLAVLVSCLMASVAAQAQEATFAVDIPAQRLDRSLNELARQTGSRILFATDTAERQQARAVQGQMTVEQALLHLLAGSGLSAQRAGEGYLVGSAASSGALELGATNVNGQLDGNSTDGSGAYTLGVTRSGTGMNLSLRETPQSISVVTRQRMDDQGLNGLTEVLQQTPGLSVQSLGSERFNIYSRGYSVDNYQFDGIPTTLDIVSQVSAQSLADMAVYDHVEVLRGASGLLTGAGDPSATINLVRKKPTAQFKGHVSAGLGSWNKYRTEVDLSGPLTPTGNVRGRMVAAYQQSDSFVDHYHQEKQVFYGILEADLSETTLLTVGADYQKNEPQGSSSVAFPLFYSNGEQTDFSRSTNSAARWSSNPQDVLNTFASVEQQLGNDWSLRVAFNQLYINREDYRLATASWGFPDPQTGAGVRLYGGAGSTWQKQLGVDAQLKGPFQAFGREHELVLGYNFSRYQNHHDPLRGTSIEGNRVNFYTWDNYTSEPNTGGGKLYDGDTSIYQSGAYLATRLRPTDNLSLILGTRVSNYRYRYDLEYVVNPALNKVTANRDSGVITPYAGIVYDLDDVHSLYASYTSIFKPQTVRDASGSTLDPREGDNYEVGLKSEYFGGRLNTSIAAFEIKQDNLAEVDPGKVVPGTTTSAYRAISGATTRGFEVEASGELQPGWNLSASYNHSITKDADGERVNSVFPANMVKLWTTYRLPGALEPLTVGGGMNWQSGIHFTATPADLGKTVKATQGQFAVFNLMARYQFNEQLSTTLNVNNLFDKKYLSALDTTFYSGYYGDPRNVMVTTRWDF